MPYQAIVGGAVTTAANETLWWTITFNGEVYVGPLYASANGVGAEDNYGTITTVQTAVNAFEDTSLPYYWPTGINYTAVLRNENPFPFTYNLSIGWFS
jgi:hypothetical protein